MKASVLQTRHANAEAPRPYDDALIPATKISGKLLSGFKQEFFAGDFPWVVSEKGLKPQSSKLSTSINDKAETAKTGMILYKGFIKVPVDGKYSFSLKTSGKAYMRLHNASLFDADFGYQSNKELIQDVNLKEGYHPVSIYLLKQSKNNETITVKWKGKEASDWKVLGDKELFYSAK